MKKLFSTLILLLSCTFIFAQAAKITDAQYEVTGAGGINIGKTNIKKLELKYPLDTKTVFASSADFEKYINNYKKMLQSTRLFESVDLSFEYELNKETNIYDVKVFIKLKDSNHLLALPYPKYSSNDGFTFKLKAKDSNFFGTLNPLSTDLFLSCHDKVSFGINFAYDFPFKAGIFNGTWNNNLKVEYTIPNKSPVFSTNLGAIFTLPLDKVSINFGLSQGIVYDTSYNLKLSENFDLATPFKLYTFENFTNLIYNPYVTFVFDWFFAPKVKTPQIGKDALRVKFGHSLSNSNVTFNDHFRKGYKASLSNDIEYIIDSGTFSPSLSLSLYYYDNWPILEDSAWLSRWGIASRLFVFNGLDFPGATPREASVGSRLRGILDSGRDYQSAIVLNLDLPVSIVTTNFPWEIINFNMQFSPFVDVALVSDSDCFSGDKEKLLTAGMEVLVNPLKFTSYTIRASLGFDVKGLLKASGFKNKIKQNEIYIGLDYHF